MADSNITNYINALQQVLSDRKNWLEISELGKLKENLRIFHTAFSTLYSVYLKKKLIDEDPYKQETKITELIVPDTSAFQDMKRIEQLSIRLSNYDNQLDFLINFYQLGMDFLNLDQLKRIVGIVRYVDWLNLTPDSQSIMTKATAELTAQAKSGVDTFTLSIIAESVNKLSKMTAVIMAALKDLNIFFRESYKLSVREKVTQAMPSNGVDSESIRKKMPQAMPGSPFYKELIEELIKEDYSPSGEDLRDTVLNNLRVPVEKPKAVKPALNYKDILMNGIQVIGGASSPLLEISSKLDENQSVLDNKKKGFIQTIKELIRQITNAEPEEIIYNVEYFDDKKGAMTREKVHFRQFMEDMGKKTKILASFVKGSAYNKLATMTEDQIIGYLERNIRETQNMHKTLNALDDFFKENADKEDRDKIKGIKPELSALKNTIIKANQLRHEYSAQKEEEEQMKRLGVKVSQAPL